MGANFTGRLARPETACFVRRLVAATSGRGPKAASFTPSVLVERRTVRLDFTNARPVKELKGDTSKTGPRQEPEQEPDQERWSPSVKVLSRAPTDGQGPTLVSQFKTLHDQADVASVQAMGQLTLDDIKQPGNMKMWSELLVIRNRLEGFEGVKKVWNAMSTRNVDMPVVGPEASVLWPTLIHACISHAEESQHEAHNDLLESILDHARELQQRFGIVYTELYSCVVGRRLRVAPHLAPSWHNRLKKDFQFIDIDIVALIPDLIAARRGKIARRSFKQIYESSSQRDIYDALIVQHLKSNDPKGAQLWHLFCMSNGDRPTQKVIAMPEVEELFRISTTSATNSPSCSYTMLASDKGRNAKYPPLTRESMSTLLGEVHGIKPKQISDEFIAKLFATRAFPLDLVIRSLSFFSVEKMGSLSLRELALRAGSPNAFSDSLRALHDMGIRYAASVYIELLFKVAQGGSVRLFEALLASDQHPDEYEDFKTQERLLARFLDDGAMIDAHLTLTGISLLGVGEHSRAWNTLLQHYIKTLDYPAVRHTVRQMQEANIVLTKRTLTFMHRHILPLRNVGRSPNPDFRRDAMILRPLQFTTNAYMYTAKLGIHVNPLLWKENLKRFAMALQWDDLERLVRWLAHWYSRRHLARMSKGEGSFAMHSIMLQNIFTDQMKEALVTWGFRHAATQHLLRPVDDGSLQTMELIGNAKCEPWAKGIQLLKEIRHDLLPVDPHLVRHAFLTRMWILFGPATSTKAINEETRGRNKLSLAHYIRHANEVWAEDLFDVDPLLLHGGWENQAKLMVALFGSRHLVNRKQAEWADVERYATAVQAGYITRTCRSGSARIARWKHSPFRLTLASSADHSLPRHRPRQLRAARSTNSHPPPSPEDTLARLSAYSPLPE